MVGNKLSRINTCLGTKFNYFTTGISVRGNGYYFSKTSRWSDQRRPYMLALEDPHDPQNNVGQNSFAILTVRAAFAYAFNILRAEQIDAPTKLSRIFNVDETMERYRQYIKSLYREGDDEASCIFFV
jgi:non-canonical poly(A) RNA polymerase PAPD5/7